jgi:hypothetical protein
MKVQWARSSNATTQEETKNLAKTAKASKVVSVFTRALAPSFIVRRRDFYIPKTPSSSKNIPNVNTYMNVFFISHIYNLATSSHAKPGLFEMTSLTLLLTSSRISPFGESSCATTPELDLQQILEFHRLPKFVALQVHGFRSLRVRNSEASQVQDSRPSLVRDFAASQVQDSRSSLVRDFAASQVQDSISSRVRDSETSQVQGSRSSRVRDSETSQVQDFRSSRVPCSWKLISRTSLISTFRGWQVFLNSPTSTKKVIASRHPHLFLDRYSSIIAWK